MIYDLHKADDREIDNNGKNKHKRLNEKERAEKKKWEAEHPEEKWDFKYTLSIESLQDSGISIDKSSILASAASNDFEYDDLYEAIDSLPVEQANLIRKLYLAGYTQKEIAEAEGVTTVAVNNRVKRILKKLKKFLSED